MFRNFLVLFLSVIIFEEYTSGMISECLDKHVQIGEKKHNFFWVIYILVKRRNMSEPKIQRSP